MIRVLLYLIIIVAFVLRVIGLNFGLPDINRFFWETDEAATINIAMGMGSGDLHPHSFNKPSLLYYITFFFYVIFYFTGRLSGSFNSPIQFAIYYLNDTYYFYIIARAIVLIFGLLTNYMTYIVGKKAFGEKTGILAAALMAVIPLNITYSMQALTDVPAIFFLLSATYYILLILENNNTKNYVLAGLFSGLAASTKYHAGFIYFLIPMFVALESFLKKVVNWKGFLYSIFFLMAGFIIGTPYAILDFSTFIVSLKTLFMVKSNVVYHPNWWFEHIKQFWEINNFGPLLLILSFIGIGYAVFKHTREDIAFLIVILIFYSFFSMPNISWSPIHYLLPIIPFLCILIARFINLWSIKKTAIFVLPVIFFPIIFLAIKTGVTLSRHDTKYYARQWVEKNIPAGSNILMTGLYDPQLTLTKTALERLNSPTNENRILLPSRGDALDIDTKVRKNLKDEKIKAITLNSPAYNIYMIYNKSFLDRENLRLGDYIKELDIDYMIISEDGWKEFRELSLFYQYRNVFESLEESFPLHTDKIIEFVPADWNISGTKITIYKIRKNI